MFIYNFNKQQIVITLQKKGKERRETKKIMEGRTCGDREDGKKESKQVRNEREGRRRKRRQANRKVIKEAVKEKEEKRKRKKKGEKEGRKEGGRKRKRGKEGGNKVGRQEGRWEEERLGERQIEYSQFSLFSCLEPFLATRVLILVPYSAL